jgi:hypothetical protein
MEFSFFFLVTFRSRIREYGRADLLRLPRDTPLFAKVGTNFADEWRSLGRCSSLFYGVISIGFPEAVTPVRVPAGSRILCFPYRPDRPWGPPRLMYNG